MQGDNSNLPTSINDNDPSQSIHILTLGDAMVGKSCLIKKYCEGKFYKEYITTIGIDYGVKRVEYDGKPFDLHFWDTGGDDVYYQIRSEFYKTYDAVLFVYDINDKQSFLNLDKWKNEFQKHALITYNHGYVVATKIDIPFEQVKPKEVEAYCQLNRFRYFATSSETGQGIESIFSAILENKNVGL